MLLLAAAHSGINTGDIIFQLVMFLILMAIPVVLIVLFLKSKKRNNRLAQLEEKMERLLAEKEMKSN